MTITQCGRDGNRRGVWYIKPPVPAQVFVGQGSQQLTLGIMKFLHSSICVGFTTTHVNCTLHGAEFRSELDTE